MNSDDREALPASVRDALAAQRPVEPTTLGQVSRVLDAVRRDRTRRSWTLVAPLLAAAAALFFITRTVAGPANGDAPPAAAGRLVAFEVSAPSASRVALVGDFNGWNAGATPMRRVNGSGRWEADLSLPSGRYVYAYVVDGTTWLADPTASIAPADDFARPSSVLVVASDASPGTRQ